MSTTKKLLRHAINIDWMVAGIAFIILVIVTFLGVIMRYFVRSPLIWLEEVQLLCFLWMAVMGGSAVFRHGSHICIDVLVDSLPPAIQRAIIWLVALVNVVVLAYLFQKGLAYSMQMLQSSRITNILGIPYAIIYGILPVGCILMIISQFVYLFEKREGDA